RRRAPRDPGDARAHEPRRGRAPRPADEAARSGDPAPGAAGSAGKGPRERSAVRRGGRGVVAARQGRSARRGPDRRRRRGRRGSHTAAGALRSSAGIARIEIAAGMARVVVVRADEGRLRVIGRGETGLAPDAVTGGLVTDRAAVGAALATAFAAAERSGAAERAIVALDGDDVRTFHVRTTFERANSTSAIVSAEM